MPGFVPKMSDRDDVKKSICFLLHKIDTPMTTGDLNVIFQSVGVDYFLLSDALSDLAEAKSVLMSGNRVSVTDKGRQVCETFGNDIPLTFKKTLLAAAIEYLPTAVSVGGCECRYEKRDSGYEVIFGIRDRELTVLMLSLHVSDEEQAKAITDNINSDPVGMYKRITDVLCTHPADKNDTNIDKYL